jgi:hypothetical protein
VGDHVRGEIYIYKSSDEVYLFCCSYLITECE